MKSEILVFVPIICAFLPQISAIECSFLEIEPNYYGCQIIKDLFNQSSELITGEHERDKSDTDVIALFINADYEIEFSPMFCKTFINLKRIHIERLDRALRDDFKDCRKLEHLLIVGTNLFWLPEDVFNGLDNLRILEITANKLQYLPRDLIVSNRRLEKFIFDDNKIEVVDLQFPSTLKEIRLLANQCIDRKMPSPEAKSVEEFNKIVAVKCGSSAAKRVIELEAKLSKKIFSEPGELENDVMKVAGAAIGFTASIPSQFTTSRDDTFKAWFIATSILSIFLIIGWIGTAFIMMKRINDMANGDHHYLVAMEATASERRREWLEE
jgi:hypothetical protein